MNWPDQCAAVIPCLNEAGTIGALVREVRQHLPSVFVVDDGSSDGTGARAAEAGAIVLTHRAPLGKGNSLRDGFRATAERGFSWALALDGDGQHSPADIPAFFRALDNSGAALVIGNRMSDPRGMPLARRCVNLWMSGVISKFCGAHLPDSQCGFRLVKLRAWEAFRYSAGHFEFESELLVRFVHAGLPVRFVPVETRYRGERSKIRPVQDTVRWFRWWRAIRGELRSATPGLFEGESSGAGTGSGTNFSAVEAVSPLTPFMMAGASRSAPARSTEDATA